MKNILESGTGAPPAPVEAKANPLEAAGAPAAPPAPARSKMLTPFDEVEEQAYSRFKQLQDLDKQMRAMLEATTELVKMGDTVTQDAVVKASGGIVAAGVPAVDVASTLAEMPENSEALQAWVGQKAQQALQQSQILQQEMGKAAYQLGLASFKSILADSAESWHARRERMN